MARGRRRTKGTSKPAMRTALLLVAVAIVIAVALVMFLGRDRTTSVDLGKLLKCGDASGFNLLLVTLDTLRMDRLGCYGYESAQTPVLDALASGGIQFEDAITSVPLTLPSHATILTGLHPPSHGVRDNGNHYLSPEHITLATTLKGRGYETAAFVSCFVLDARFGLDQGFDLYDFQVTEKGHRPRMTDFNERPADAVSDEAIEWLRERTEAGREAPFFLWVHYFDPHLPYKSPLKGLPRFARKPYDAEIAFVDQQLGRLLDELGRQNLTDNTLIVVVADHGESLGEHEEPAHGLFVYDCVMRVPFILSCPALIDGPRHIKGQAVGLVDVRPTLEDLLGLEPARPCDGRSLLRSWDSGERALYIETEAPLNMFGWSPLYGLRTATRKYIHAPVPEYYDLREDPNELNNQFTSGPGGLADLQQRLDALMEEWQQGSVATRALSDEEIERLSSLGYLHSSSSDDSEDRSDPKQMMPAFNKASRAEKLLARGEYEEAADLAREVVDVCPECTNALRVLAFSYMKMDRADEAVALLRGFVEEHENVYMIRSLAQMLILRKDYDGAEAVLDLYESVDPRDGRVYTLRGDCMTRRNRLREAIELYERAIEVDENRSGILARERIVRTREAMQGGE
ncbi:sulfatase-like hydrolase/transferase [Candidatus Eisenbacteria bacterium]|uniref:Sulfatase-like hydrolase/transferase n=1 Tax=Eiseniibacteriota bacterium TaxID=2212470 RepID=A0ABV6YLH8_UNCEI